jgi:hypothetical protein
MWPWPWPTGEWTESQVAEVDALTRGPWDTRVRSVLDRDADSWRRTWERVRCTGPSARSIDRQVTTPAWTGGRAGAATCRDGGAMDGMGSDRPTDGITDHGKGHLFVSKHCCLHGSCRKKKTVCMEAPTCGHHMHTYGKDKVQRYRYCYCYCYSATSKFHSLATWHVTVPPARAYVPQTHRRKLSISIRSYDYRTNDIPWLLINCWIWRRT